jgi:hypothetical protein
MRKKWHCKEIKLLLHLQDQKVPLKILSWIFNVTPNSVSKTLGRYSDKHKHPLNNKNIIIMKEEIQEKLQWIYQKKFFFQDICCQNIPLEKKAIIINKTLHQYGWPPLELELIKLIILNFKNNQ